MLKETLNKGISAPIAITIIFILAIIVGGFAWWQYSEIQKGETELPEIEVPEEEALITTFEECVAKGYPILESYPRQCRTPDDKNFTENIGNELEKSDLMRVSTPRPNQIVQSPLVIEGEARGFWFFEADFLVVLVDWDGLIIAEGIARAKDEWMTEDFVPFEAKIEFEKPTVKNNGTLILRKDNPSGLPEHDDALEIPIFFK